MQTIYGYASVFNIPDASGDIIMPGAFTRTLKNRPPHLIKMLFHHDPQKPLGIWTHIEEDLFGLKILGALTPGVSYIQDLSALLLHGALDGLSIGFKTIQAQKPKHQQYRLLYEVDLWEISLVTFPMLQSARLQTRM